jgi:hypothetical protein
MAAIMIGHFLTIGAIMLAFGGLAAAIAAGWRLFT